MEEILNTDQIQQFINNGFICIKNAFSAEDAAKARDILWRDMGLNPNAPETWTQPVVWLGMYPQEPFVKAANTKILHSAFNQLVGPGRWLPCKSMGTFPVRFPSPVNAGDTGWHVDAGFPGTDPGNYFEWRINVKSKGRGLLMLFLFSDVEENDAPTRIRAGSHFDVARLLKPEGDNGLSFMELAAKLAELPEKQEALATGRAGTVYLCHPFMVHAAQPHHGKAPRFLAQPPLLLKDEFKLDSSDSTLSPVEKAIVLAIGR
ncbi:MAG TPA: phytanoyl-CoA dioxygenase [Bacteroidia bacterium]|nr:phytanoyl-CoA dioxygenase [Bacteroidia bacterium]